jgi:hypothetical protein
MVSILRRREVPMALCIFTTVFLLFSYYTDIGLDLASNFRVWMTQISMFAMIVGVIMLIQRHTQIIMRRNPGWQYSIIVFFFLVMYLIVQYSSEEVYTYVLNNIYTPMMYAGTGAVVPIVIYYRGARVKSLYSAILIVTLFISNFYNSVIGPVLFGPGILPLGAWIKDVINTGSMRAITIGMGLGLLVVLIRVILGMEVSYLGEVK